MESCARIHVMDVRALIPSMYKEIYGLNYRDAGWIQQPLKRARSGRVPATIAVLVEHGKVLSYVLHHPFPISSDHYTVQAWTRAVHRHRGYHLQCMAALNRYLSRNNRKAESVRVGTYRQGY